MAVLDFTFDSWVNGDNGNVSVSCKSHSTSNVTVTPNGVTPQVITMAAVGTDGQGAAIDSGGGGTPAGYFGFTTFTGLTDNTSYTMTVEQDGTTYNGKFRTRPTSDFCFFVVACDNYEEFVPSTSDPAGSKNGVYGYIEEFDKTGSLPVAALIKTDDIGYTDTLREKVDDRGAGGTNKFSVSTFGDTLYGRILAAFAYYGMFPTDQQNVGYKKIFTDGDSRQYCRHHIPFMWSNGDHDFSMNNPEEQAAGLTVDQKQKVKDAVLATFGNATNYINSTNSLAWINRMGPVEIIAMDRVTSLPTSTQVYDVPNLTNNSAGPIVDWLGATQISDVQGAVDETSKFKAVLLPMDLYQVKSQADLEAARDGTDGSGSSWTGPAGLSALGAQQPLDMYTKNLAGTDSEATELMTKNTVSIAAKAQTNNACVVLFHGDKHHPGNRHIVKASDASNVAFDAWQFDTGATGNDAHDLHPDIVAGFTYEGVTIDWVAPFAIRPNGQYANESTCLRVDVTWQGCLWRMTVNTVRIPDPETAPTVADIMRTHVIRKNTVACCG